MELNIHSERETPFDFKIFKNQVELFLLRNEIICSDNSVHLTKITLMLKEIIKQEILNKESKDTLTFDNNIKEAFKQFQKFNKSEVFENLRNNEKSVFLCLIDFTKQYIEALQNNKYYYNDKIIHYETLLLKSNTNEMFNYSKKFFMLCLKNRKISFNEVVKKEIEKFKIEYGFEDIFYRNPINVHDKVILLKNIENLKEALKEISNDLKINKNQLSLNGLISLSLEPTILGYSSAAAYMNKKEDNYVISLGNYKSLNALKESYVHEMAHCFDFTQKTKDKNLTYSEEAILNLLENSEQNPIDKIMEKELGLLSSKQNVADKMWAMKEDIFKTIEEEFNIPKEIHIQYHPLLVEGIGTILDNYYQINTYALLKIKVVLALHDEKYFKKSIDLKNQNYSEQELEEKFTSLENKFREIKNKHGYVVSQNLSYFIPDEKIDLLFSDVKNKKHYYAKPVEIFARSFERIYTENSTMYIKELNQEEKEIHKLLLKEALEYMSPENTLKIKRTIS